MLGLLGKGWQLPISPRVVLLPMLTEAISEERGLGSEHSSVADPQDVTQQVSSVWDTHRLCCGSCLSFALVQTRR